MSLAAYSLLIVYSQIKFQVLPFNQDVKEICFVEFTGG